VAERAPGVPEPPRVDVLSLGHPRPAEALAKAELARRIGAITGRCGLTQAAAAEPLEVDQPKVSALTRGRLAGFLLDRLVRFLVLLEPVMYLPLYWAPEFGTKRDGQTHPSSAADRLSQ